MRKVIVVATFLALLGLFTRPSVGQAPPQGRAVIGTGSPGWVPLWTTTSGLGNSSISEDANGGISVSAVGNGYAVGIIGTTPDSLGIGVRGMVTSTTGQGTGVWGENSSSTDGANAIVAHETGATGATFGLNVSTDSPQGIAVQAGSRNVAVAAFNQFCSNTGCTMAPGIAGQFVTAPGGIILDGRNSSGSDSNLVFQVNGAGRVFAAGGFTSTGADFAESFSVRGESKNYQPGDLLVIDATSNRRLALSHQPYSTLVAGIYSTKPGVLATERKNGAMDGSHVPLAVVGVVPCKVSTENGPISPGDLLVTSSTLGYAMRGTDHTRMLGAVVGKALEPLQKGRGTIRVLVTLQ